MAIFNQKGNTLLFVIIGMTMVAALGTGMFYMTSTSTLGQAGGSGMNRAYYLALAGKDYTLANWNIRSQLTGNEFTVSSTERFYLSISDSQITSTGIVNKDTPFEARKTIIAQSPSSAKRHFLDTFEDLTKWATGAQVGGHAIAPVSGDNALHVLSSASAFGSGQWSFLQLKTGTGVGSVIDFSSSWQDAGYCLSHDLQVKIANILSPQPYYMAGLNFKVAGIGDSREFYGVSFLRAMKRSLFGGAFIDFDNIPNELKPPFIYAQGLPYESLYIESILSGIIRYQYSHPAIVLWKRYLDSDTGHYSFAWLAYKLLTGGDYVVYDNNQPGNNYLLSSWSNLQVRLNEAYPLNFTKGGPALLHNAIVEGKDSGAMARISGTPIITSGSLSNNDAIGILTISHWNGIQFQDEDLTTGVTKVSATTFTTDDKKNYIRVYYGDEGSHGANINPTDNTRGSNPRNAAIHWPVDNASDWKTENDYMTILTWDAVNTAIVNPPEKLTERIKVDNIPTFAQFDTIIKDGSLLTPDGGAIDHSGIALHATGNTATYTYFDDFAVQY